MFQVDQFYHGFKLLECRHLDELNGDLYHFKHLKSGATLFYLANSEDNKLFSVTFKTTPCDDTGVFHILEHSLLNGSKKYPLKEPFVELLKSSMNTFLNAMTFPDKTVYPVSSRNQKDFENLMSVYLDAVFAPAIYQNPNIFYQEGWHYELNNAEDQPLIKGVVYNEMKGAFANIDSLIDTEMTRMLFKDNCYGYCSGGDPEHIPELSYEQFLATHREYYHPANACFYLDGNMDIDKALKLIGEEYLDRFTYQNIDHAISEQKTISKCEKIIEYPITTEEESTEAAHLAMGHIIGSFADKKKIYAAEILADYLFGNNDSPLKRALLESKLLKDVDCFINDDIQEPYLVTIFRNCKPEDFAEIKKIYSRTLAAIVKEGIDTAQLQAAMNQFEFKLREKSEPKALYNCFALMSSYLYGGDPELYLCVGDIFEQLRASLESDYFVQLLKELFLDEQQRADLVLMPSLKKEEEDAKALKQKLTALKNSWSLNEVQAVITLNKELAVYQQKVDTKEELACLPVLDIREISEDPYNYELIEKEADGIKVLYHPHALSGITYLQLYFSLNDLQPEQLPLFGLIDELLGSLPTSSHSVYQLQSLIKRDLGSLSINVASYASPKENDCTQLKLAVSLSFLNEKLPKALALLKEILFETRFDDYDSIKEILEQSQELYKQSIITGGHAYAIKQATAAFNCDCFVKNELDGYANYQWLKNTLKEEGGIAAFAAELQSILNKVLCKDRLIISVCAKECPDLSTLAGLFKEGAADKDVFTWTAETKEQRSGICIPSQVGYAVKAGILPGFNTGALKVLCKICSLDYLWNEIRVKGGAYGAGLLGSDSGIIAYYSYRDPSPEQSLTVYDHTAAFLEQFLAKDEDIGRYYFSCIADLEPLISVRREALIADSDYFRKISFSQRKQERLAILHTGKEELRTLLTVLDNCAANGSVCVSANSEMLNTLGIEKQLNL